MDYFQIDFNKLHSTMMWNRISSYEIQHFWFTLHVIKSYKINQPLNNEEVFAVMCTEIENILLVA